MFESILYNLEECIISIDDEKGINFSNKQGIDVLVNLFLSL